MPMDYQFTQKMINFGRELGAKFVGQPFRHYRLNNASTVVIDNSNEVLDPLTNAPFDLRAKVSGLRSRVQVEGTTMHAEPFELLLSSERVQTEDIVVQNDPLYGGNAAYCIASLRPLKKVVAIRVESTAKIWRPTPNRTSGYNEVTLANHRPLVLTAGEFDWGVAGGTATDVPVGLTYIGQIKDQKVTRMPLDTTTSWWYVYVPLFPGMARLRENDILEMQVHEDEKPVRYRIHAPYVVEVGLRGILVLCERIGV